VTQTQISLEELLDRVQKLEAVEEIRTLRCRFHRYVNDDEWGRIGELFTEDAYLDYAHLGQVSGRADIHAYFERMPRVLEKDETAVRTLVRQFLHTHEVRVDGDTATGTSYLEAKTVYHGESFVVCGKFTDSYARRDGEWLFDRIELQMYWMVPLHEGWAQPDRIKMTLS
jgi:ketosteroid isomerase-like protein